MSGQPIKLYDFGTVQDLSGQFVPLVTSTSNSKALVSFVAAQGTGLINPLFYGAVADGVTDCTEAFQAAIDAALATGASILVPSGTFFFAAASPSLDPGTGNIAFVGASRENSILSWNEGNAALGSGNEKFLFYNFDDIAKGSLSFSNLTIRGTYATRQTQIGGNVTRLAYYSAITCHNCWIDNCTQGGIEVLYCGRFLVDGCWFTNMASDPCRARDTGNAIVVNNYFNRNGDDSIALHTATATIPTTQPIREGLIVQNNCLVNAGIIKCLGGRKINVSNNYMHLSNINCISIGAGDGTEGDDAAFDITITGNVMSDPIRVTSVTPTQANAYIALAFATPRAATATNNVIPMRYDSVSGTIIKPWDWYQEDLSNLANAVPPGNCVVISNNSAGRTVPNVAAFSDYGYGSVIRTGTQYDPAMTDANLRPDTFLQVNTCAAVSFTVQNNNIQHVGSGITIPAPTTDAQIKALKITGNSFFDITNRGVFVASGVFFADGVIDNNDFNLDYFRENTNSTITGSYLASSVPRAIDVGSCIGLAMRHNKFSNCCATIQGNSLASCLIEDNIAFTGTPVALGFNTGNKGIGTILNGYRQFRYAIVDADPTSATYNALSSVMAMSAGSIPTSGWYYQGWMVWNDAPTSGGKVIGWMRLTTGTGHISGTDWLVVTSA